MQNFDFKLRTPAGRVEQGRLRAQSQDAALQELQARGSGRVVELKRASVLGQELKLFNPAPGPMILSLFCSQLGMMFRAGVSQTDSLRALIRTTDNARLRDTLTDVREKVERGQAITHAMSQHPDIFDRSFLALLTAALKTNTVPATLERLSTMYERNHKVAQEVRSALVQPTITVVIALGVMFIVTIAVIPQFQQMLTSMNVTLPAATRVLLGTAAFMRSPWMLLVFAALAVAFVLARQSYRTPEGRAKVDAFILKLPKVGTLVRLGALSRVNRTLSTLLANGVGKVEALDIAARASGNSVLEAVLLEGKENVARGNHLYQVLERHPKLFPATITGMVNTGEQQGELARMLDRVSDFYERQVETDARNITKFVEPLMFVVIGVMVMGLMLAVLSPIMSVVNNLST